jgi:hypothetical protein
MSIEPSVTFDSKTDEQMRDVLAAFPDDFGLIEGLRSAMAPRMRDIVSEVLFRKLDREGVTSMVETLLYQMIEQEQAKIRLLEHLSPEMQLNFPRFFKALYQVAVIETEVLADPVILETEPLGRKSGGGKGVPRKRSKK